MSNKSQKILTDLDKQWMPLSKEIALTNARAKLDHIAVVTAKKIDFSSVKIELAGSQT